MAGKLADELEEELTCVICKEPYDDPVILSCNHSFCRQCITAWVQQPQVHTGGCSISGNKGDDTIRCPICRASTPLHSEKVSKLPPNFQLVNIVKKWKASVDKTEDEHKRTMPGGDQREATTGNFTAEQTSLTDSVSLIVREGFVSNDIGALGFIWLMCITFALQENGDFPALYWGLLGSIFWRSRMGSSLRTDEAFSFCAFHRILLHVIGGLAIALNVLWVEQHCLSQTGHSGPGVPSRCNTKHGNNGTIERPLPKVEGRRRKQPAANIAVREQREERPDERTAIIEQDGVLRTDHRGQSVPRRCEPKGEHHVSVGRTLLDIEGERPEQRRENIAQREQDEKCPEEHPAAIVQHGVSQTGHRGQGVPRRRNPKNGRNVSMGRTLPDIERGYSELPGESIAERSEQGKENFEEGAATKLSYGGNKTVPKKSGKVDIFRVGILIWLMSEHITHIDGVKIADMHPVNVPSIHPEVKLICAFEQSNQDRRYSVDWNKDDQPVISRRLDGRMVVGDMFVGRAKLIEPASLLLSTLRVNDSGLYTCTVLVPDDSLPVDSKSVQLTVKDVPPGESIERSMSLSPIGLILGIGVCVSVILSLPLYIVCWRKRRQQLGAKQRDESLPMPVERDNEEGATSDFGQCAVSGYSEDERR